MSKRKSSYVYKTKYSVYFLLNNSHLPIGCCVVSFFITPLSMHGVLLTSNHDELDFMVYNQGPKDIVHSSFSYCLSFHIFSCSFFDIQIFAC